MLARLTDRALALWLAYLRRVRHDERNADARAAAIIAAIYESRRNPKRRARAFTAKDFIPTYPDDQPVAAPTTVAPTLAPGTPRPPSTTSAPRRMSADESARYAVSIFERASRKH